MGNLEKYGVLALIFVIVLILTVAIWNGPGDAKRSQQQQQIAKNEGNPGATTPGADVNNPNNANNNGGTSVVTPGGLANDELKARPAIAEELRRQQEDEARKAAELAKNANGNNNKNAAGIVPGGAPVADGGAAIEKNPNFKKYKIAKGDTFQSIAGKQLGSKARWKEIEKANEGVNASKLKIGQEILIPTEMSSNLASNDVAKGDLSAARKDKKDNSRLAKSSR